MSLTKEDGASISSEHNESDDSQNINGSQKESQNSLEDELEYNKNEIIEVFNEVNQMPKKIKKVSFKEDKNLVTIIEVESYKKYNQVSTLTFESLESNCLKAYDECNCNEEYCSVFREKRKFAAYVPWNCPRFYGCGDSSRLVEEPTGWYCSY